MNDDEKGVMFKIPYGQAVGSLMFIMVCTRPDLSLAMGKVTKYMANPGKLHWEGVKWIARVDSSISQRYYGLWSHV